MILDSLPIHWAFLFQTLTIITVFLIMWQIHTAYELDKLRWNGVSERGIFFHFRRLTMFLKALALCWIVIYGDTRSWQPWPPFVAFLFAFDLNIIGQIMVMRQDIERVRKRMGLGRGSALPTT